MTATRSLASPDPTDPCPSLADLLLASEDALPLRQLADIRAHMGRCPKCRQELAAADATVAAFAQVLNDRAWGTDSGDADLHPQMPVDACIPQVIPRTYTPSRGLVMLLVIVLVTGAISIFALSLSHRDRPTPAPTWTTSTPYAPPAAGVGAATPALTPADAAPDERALDDAELEARRVLHAMDADLQGVEETDMRVLRTARQIQAIGSVPADRADTLRMRLQAIPLVLPTLRPARVSRHDADAITADGLTDDVTQRLERLCARTAAYHALAERYDAAEAQRLALAGRQKLQSLIDAHHADLVQEVQALSGRLAVYLKSLRATNATVVPPEWRTQARAADACARQLREAFARFARDHRHDDTDLRHLATRLSLVLDPPSPSTRDVSR